jgi:pyruvate, orthophosphate dikinase
LHEGDVITLDGNDGAIYAGAAQTKLVYPDDLLKRLSVLRRGAKAATVPARCEK